MGILIVLSLLCHAFSTSAQQIDLGEASFFAALGTASITNTGPSIIDGDIGLFPGTSITGFPPGTQVNGVQNIDNLSAVNAIAAALSAYDTIATFQGQDLTGQDLGGKVLGPGTYSFMSSAQLTGPLTLLSSSSLNATWYFKVGTALTTAAGSVVLLQGTTQACNVFWQIGSSATIGAGTQFVGTVLAGSSITMVTAASSNGGLFALDGSVTLDTNRVNIATCPMNSSSSVSSSTAGGGAGGGVGTTGGVFTTAGGGAGGGLGTSGGVSSSSLYDTSPTALHTSSSSSQISTNSANPTTSGELPMGLQSSSSSQSTSSSQQPLQTVTGSLQLITTSSFPTSKTSSCLTATVTITTPGGTCSNTVFLTTETVTRGISTETIIQGSLCSSEIFTSTCTETKTETEILTKTKTCTETKISMETCTETETCTTSITRTKTAVWEITIKETATITTTKWWDRSAGGDECWPWSIGCTNTVYATMTIETERKDDGWEGSQGLAIELATELAGGGGGEGEEVAVASEGGSATSLSSDIGSAVAAGRYANNWSGALISNTAIASSPAAIVSSASIVVPNNQVYVVSNGGGNVIHVENILGYVWSVLFIYRLF